jgi:hypothetical protein
MFEGALITACVIAFVIWRQVRRAWRAEQVWQKEIARYIEHCESWREGRLARLRDL